jgi:hypothetical protein
VPFAFEHLDAAPRAIEETVEPLSVALRPSSGSDRRETWKEGLQP